MWSKLNKYVEWLFRRLTLPHAVAMLLGLIAVGALQECENAFHQMAVGLLWLSASVVFAGAEVAEAVREGHKRESNRP